MSDYKPGQLDGDATAKTFDKGASSAAGHSDLSDGLHEAHKIGKEPVGEKTTGAGTSAFSADGSIGKQFTAEGAIGGTAQKIGGPFDKDGAIGKQFTTGGNIGGSVQEHLGKGESSAFQKQ